MAAAEASSLYLSFSSQNVLSLSQTLKKKLLVLYLNEPFSL